LLTSITLIATLFPLVCFVAYPFVVDRLERARPSLSLLMNAQRRRWVANAVRRDTPMDAILSGNLMNSVSFFASTTVLLVLALFAVFGQLGSVVTAMAVLQPHLDQPQIELELITILVMFVLAFLSFTLSLRQFNHFCIMLGAVGRDGQPSEDEITTVAALNSLGARSFNNGLRAYYFSIASLTWFVSTLLSVAATLVIIAFLIYREFFSAPRMLVETLRKD
jgi:uncharacterized membrane protein